MKYGAAGGSSGCSMSFSVGSGAFLYSWYCAREMAPVATMSLRTRSRRLHAADRVSGWSGLNAVGLATMPASSAAWAGLSCEEQECSGGSPQPCAVPASAVVAALAALATVGA